ncbi:MAG: 1,4-alpha-glucan branching protein GlgB [Anaerolineae bacterium]|nr:1,4-alpha-glucan branching protein GlgB [Anaerolineae bacterium]
MVSTISPDALEAVAHADHGSPFSVLGVHPQPASGFVIRTFQPNAATIAVILNDEAAPLPMQKIHPAGIFEAVVDGAAAPSRYRYEMTTHSGDVRSFFDPFDSAAYPFQISELDVYLFRQGRNLEIYEKMGAHIREVDGVQGVNFVVWAPNARRVSVIGVFNNWDARVHPMHRHGDSGVWELFIPGVTEGTIYRYSVRSQHHGYQADKSDPYGFYFQMRPENASIVYDITGYAWGDQAWMTARAEASLLKKPVAIYELHGGSWKHNENGEWLSYRELANQLIPYLKDLGFTHIELMPIAEHPFDGSWGYQVTGYYAPTSRYGSPKDFMYFVDICHQNGIGVILDWVPAHFPKDGYALSYFDGTHLYSHEDPRLGEHPDWGTYIFNYGRNEVRNFLLANALFWLRYYHIDGLRVDAVASMLYLDYSRKAGQWVPNQYGSNENLEAIAFLREFNTLVHREAPGAVTIAEESTSWPMVSRPTYVGGLGFTFKWNMGWMHDTLDYFKLNPIFRRYHHNLITFLIVYAFSENFVLALSHDEVVHLKGSLLTKMPGDWWQKFASLRLLYGMQYGMPGKKLNFMGHEFGQWEEWGEAKQLEWNLTVYPTHSGVQSWIRDLNRVYREQPALFEQDFDGHGFEWINANDVEQNVYTWMRFAEDHDDYLVIAANCTPVPRMYYRVGVPDAGVYDELLNSDAHVYGGGDVGNGGSITTETIPWGRFQQSLSLTLPPLGIIVLRLRPSPARAGEPTENVDVAP